VLPRWTVWSRARDCLVHQGTVAQRLRWHWWREATGLSGVTRGLSRVKACSANCQLRCQIQRPGAPDRGTGLSSAPPDCRCAIESSNFSPMASFVLGAINTPQTGHFKEWEPKQHNKAYSRHFQELIHPSA
jgi:hypothetical protein